MSANDSQVSGSHYRSSLQHWDFVLLAGLGYLEGCATKYVTRWRRKNGLDDLRKARHYVEKLLEQSPEQESASLFEAPRRPHAAYGQIREFCEANDVPSLLERDIIGLLSSWRGPADIRLAHSLLERLIQQQENQA